MTPRILRKREIKKELSTYSEQEGPQGGKKGAGCRPGGEPGRRIFERAKKSQIRGQIRALRACTKKGNLNYQEKPKTRQKPFQGPLRGEEEDGLTWRPWKG